MCKLIDDVAGYYWLERCSCPLTSKTTSRLTWNFYFFYSSWQYLIIFINVKSAEEYSKLQVNYIFFFEECGSNKMTGTKVKGFIIINKN